MALPKEISYWLTHHITQLTHPSKPLLRLTLFILTTLLLLLAASKALFPTNPYTPHFTSPDRIDYSSSHAPNAPSTHYTPSDLHLPAPPSLGIAPESRIGKISILLNGKDELMNHALRTHEAHNRRFGYPLYILRHGLLDGGGVVGGEWNKPAYLLGVVIEEMRKPVGERLEWLFWHDADTILLNPHIPLSLFLPPSLPSTQNIHLLATADPRGLNTGAFLLRIHPWSISLLTALLAHPTFFPSAQLEYRDQSAMALVLALPPFRNHWVEVPPRWFNAYAAELGDQWTHEFPVRRGDLLVHVAGPPAQAREEGMGMWFERSEQTLEKGEWAVEVRKTSLPGEVERFWREWGEEAEERGREREGVRGEVLEVGRRVEGWLGEFGGGVSEEERGRIYEGLRGLKGRVEDEEVDAVGLREGMEELMETTTPLRLLLATHQKSLTLTRDAHALILEAERFLLDQNISRDPATALRLQEQLENMREVLAREPDDRGKIRAGMDKLREAAQEFAVRADGESGGGEGGMEGGDTADGGGGGGDRQGGEATTR
ncbi:hypothetical protein MMC30_000302 [Trapelia coarctata]|nr:hypothetical protein [Trapelia coarctata]